MRTRCRVSPVPVYEGTVNGEISLNGDGDCHEDAGRVEDVVERPEEVGIEMDVELNYPASKPVGPQGVETLGHTVNDTQHQEEKVCNRQGHQQVVEVAFEGLL